MLRSGVHMSSSSERNLKYISTLGDKARCLKIPTMGTIKRLLPQQKDIHKLCNLSQGALPSTDSYIIISHTITIYSTVMFEQGLIFNI